MAGKGLLQVATELSAHSRGVQGVPDTGLQEAFVGRGGLSSSLEHMAGQVGKLADHAAQKEGEFEGRQSGMDPEFRPRRDNTLRGDAFDRAGLQVAEARLKQQLDAGLDSVWEKNNGNATALAKGVDGVVAGILDGAPAELRPTLEIAANGKRLSFMRDAARQHVAQARAEQAAALNNDVATGLRNLHQQGFSLGLDEKADETLSASYAALEGVLARKGLDGKPLVDPTQRESLLRGARQTMIEARLLGAFGRLEGPQAKGEFIQKLEQDWQSGEGLAKEFDLRGMRAMRSMLEGELRRTESERGIMARSLEKQIKDVARAAEKGITPSPDDMASLKSAVTSSGNPELAGTLDAAEATMKWMQGASRGTPGQLQAYVEAEDARLKKDGYKIGAGEIEHVDAAKKLLGEMRKGVKDDPLGWASQVRLVDVPPLSFESNDAFRTSLSQRIAKAEQVGAIYDQAPVFLRPEERRRMIALAAPGGAQLLDVVKQISAAAGPRAADVLGEIAPQAPTLAVIGGHVGLLGNTAVAMDVADGVALARTKDYKPATPASSKAQQWLYEALGNALGGVPQNERAFIDATNAAYAVRLQRRGEQENADVWKSTLRQLLGERSRAGETFGGVTQYRGTSIVVPPDIKQGEFGSLVRAIRPEDFGDNPPRNAAGPATLSEIRGAKLTVRPGNGGNDFYLNTGSEEAPQWLVDKSGKPFVLNLAQLKPALLERRPDAYWDGPATAPTRSPARTQNLINQPTFDEPPMRLGGPKGETPFDALRARSKGAGFDLDGAEAKALAPDKAIERAFDEIWRQAPTDDNAALIEGLAVRHGVTPPWAKKKGK